KHLILGFLVIGVFAFGLTAVQLLPAMEFISLSNRATFDYNFAKQGSMHIYDYITLIVPKYFGVWSGNDKIGDIQYWSKHQEGPWMFSIANVFMSVLILIIFYPALKYFIKEKKNQALLYTSVFIIVFSFLFSLGGNFFFHKLVFDFIPFFNRFRNPAHVVYIAMTSILLVSFAGLNGIVSDKKMKVYFTKKYFVIILSVSFILFLYLMTGSAIPDYAAKVTQVTSFVSKQAFIFFLFFVIYTVIIYLFTNGKLKFSVFGYSLVVILLFEIYFIWFDQNNGTRNPEQVFNQKPQLTERFRQELKNDKFRVNMRDGGYMLLQRNQGFIDNIEYLEGYGALLLKNFIPPKKSNPGSTQSVDLLNVKYMIMTDSAGKKYLGLNETYIPRAKMYYDAVEFNSEDEVRNFMASPEFDYRKTLAIESNDNLVLPKSAQGDSLPKNIVKITEYSLNTIKIDVETEADGLLYLSEVYYPAWNAYVDGNNVKILKTDFCMRSVPVTKGKHKVELRYESDVFAKGKTITMLTLVLFILSIPLSVYFNRKQKS
ncbi:MAG: YfhO family protein, partial [Ignavibacteria bacterium]|nr:YfhO family protein [Ignavibacteria bacterium]